MNETFQITLYGLLTGVVGTGLGAILAFLTNKKGVRFMSSILEYAAGMMLAVVLIDLFPQAFERASLFEVMFGMIIGIIFMLLTECITDHSSKKSHLPKQKEELFSLGLTMAIGISLHNLPEGLAVGSGFDAAKTLGISLAITILIHDIPEGIAMAIPLKSSGLSPFKVIMIASASGIPTGVGAFLGSFIGNFSQSFISFCLSLASGAMLYVALADIIPQSKKLYKGRLSSLFNILGVITGIIISICI